MLRQIVGPEHLGLQGASIAVNAHLRGIGEPRLAYHLVSELVYTGMVNSDFRPPSLAEHGVCCIAVCLGLWNT